MDPAVLIDSIEQVAEKKQHFELKYGSKFVCCSSDRGFGKIG